MRDRLAPKTLLLAIEEGDLDVFPFGKVLIPTHYLHATGVAAGKTTTLRVHRNTGLFAEFQ